KLSQTKSASILLWDPEEERLTVKMAANAPETLVGMKLKLGEGQTGRAAQERKILAAGRGDQDDPLFSGGPADPLGMTLSVPLVREEGLVGALWLAAGEPDRNLPEETLEELEFFASHAAIALFNARTF